MRKIFIFVTAILLFIISSKKILAEVIQGNSSAQSSVTTNVSGNGQVHTRIEIEQNGVKKVVESDKPGKIEVKVENNSSSVKINGVEQETNNSTASSSNDKSDKKVSPSASLAPTVMPKPNQSNNVFLNSLKELLQKFFKSFLSF